MDYTHLITIEPGIDESGKGLVYVRRRDPALDTEAGDAEFIALTSRCSHVGCPVNYVRAAQSFVCPCHAGVYDFRAAAKQLRFHLDHRLLGISPGTVGILF